MKLPHVVLAVTYAIAALIVLLDVFIWRPL
jgi:hypothetical protein